MITQSILTLIFNLVKVVINTLSIITLQSLVIPQEFINFMQSGLYIVGVTPFKIVISSFLLWYGAILAWGIFEWVYKKIPGVS